MNISLCTMSKWFDFWFFFTVNISFIQTDQCQISSFFYQICLPQKCHKNINSWKAVSAGISASLISVGHPVNTRNKSWGGVQHGLWPSVQMGNTGQTQPTCPDWQPLIRTTRVFILSLQGGSLCGSSHEAGWQHSDQRTYFGTIIKYWYLIWPLI